MRNNRNFHYYLDLLDANKYSAEQIARYITEWNNTPPHNKSCAENATQWLRDEFNPLITESMAPVITEFHVTTIYEGYVAPLVPNAKAHVVAEIRDVAGISRVRIRSLCPDVIYILMIWEQEFQFSGEETTVYIDTVIDVTEYSAVLTYNISVNATDTLGNSAEWYKEVDGPVGAFIKTVANMLRAFWSFLCEIGKVVAKAFEILVEWIVNLLRSAFELIIEGIKSLIGGLTYKLGTIIEGMISGKSSEKNIGVFAEDIVISVLGVMQIVRVEESIENAFIMLDSGAVAVEGAVTVYSGGILTTVKGIIVKIVKDLIEKRLILTMVSQALALTEFMAQFSNVIKALFTGTIDAMINAIKSAIGISEKLADALKNVAMILANLGKKNVLRRYYFGFSLAILGFLTSTVSAAMGFTGMQKIGADLVMVAVAFGGFFTLKRGEDEQPWRKVIASLVTNIEFLIALAGFASALFDLAWDWTHGGE